MNYTICNNCEKKEQSEKITHVIAEGYTPKDFTPTKNGKVAQEDINEKCDALCEDCYLLYITKIYE